MARLLSLGNLRLTPVLISQELQWRQVGQATPDQSGLLAQVEAWNQARMQDDDNALRNHYSERFERDGTGLETWWPKLRNGLSGRAGVRPLEMLSAMRWQDQDELMVVTWLDPNRSTAHRSEYLRTYWAREGSDWKIVFEGPV